MTEYAPLDVASYLDDEEIIAEYLTAAAEDENPDALLFALASLAKARGMAQVARGQGAPRRRGRCCGTTAKRDGPTPSDS